ncbi:DEAD/DEAH box helicase [Aquisalibacillus elongatus]|uniref:ATP-dependent RNA helicase CshB n=1 Tax=Aquisalibacillus elongatus TaxID=485577 RepID=A0A3N5BDQ8_9BACI|nr:DEAD/DEAH box helicase [Aquisalibacillus elongatus]RPF55613.1 ATP-dependent RNA helicase CshB [Aquisalibacillus elongatus]
MKHYFQSYDLSSNMLNVIHQLNFKHPTEIQHRVIPAALKTGNIIGQSQTGSGKTHAYLIPLIDQLKVEEEVVQKMIIAPTRELAMQIHEEVKKINEFSSDEFKFRSRLVIGGTDKERELQKFNTQPHVVVGTPGRILDFIQERAINPSYVESVVIDEADLLIDLGLIEEVDQTLNRMHADIQTLVFSATIPKRLQQLLSKYLINPTYITVEDSGNRALEHRLIPRRHRSAAQLIVESSKLIHPYIALIFVNKKEHADELREQLLDQGLEAGVIHGGLKPRERKRVLNDLRDLRYQYIVATDLAARGIDIPGVSHVFNAEFPMYVETYTHRVGRTARAGNKGTAVTFYDDENMPIIEKLEEQGIEFHNYDIKKGEWVEVKDWNQRQKRKQEENQLEKEAWKRVKKRKKVKPGYKKKMRQEKEQFKKQLKKEQYKKKGRRS